MNRIHWLLFPFLLLCFSVNAWSLFENLPVGKTIFVHEPTGNPTVDHDSIVSALSRAGEGDILQFAPGIYQVGRKIQVATNGITLRGDKAGTVIRGCNPENFTEHLFGILNCGGFEIIGKNTTVENFTFEYAWHGLMVGCCLPENMDQLESGSNIRKEQFGGHIIQNNIFRFNSTGIRVIGIYPETVVIGNNVFQDNYHGLTINGSRVSVRGNRFYKSTPEKIPIDGEIENAIGILPFTSMFPPDQQPEFQMDCEGIELVGNSIEGIELDILIGDSSLCKPVIINHEILK